MRRPATRGPSVAWARAGPAPYSARMSETSSSEDRRDPAELSFEQAAAELESIIARIESGEIGLEESLAEWRHGGALLKRCREVLDHAERELAAADLPEEPAAEEA